MAGGGGGGVPAGGGRCAPLAATLSTWPLMLLRCSAKLMRLLVSYRIRLLVGIRGHNIVLHFAFLIAEASLNIDIHDFIATIE